MSHSHLLPAFAFLALASSQCSPLAAQERVANEPAGASTTAGDYVITVQKVADLRDGKMTVEFDASKIAVQQQGGGFGNPQAGGSTGGASGSASGQFLKPNLGIALSVEPKTKKPGTIIELARDVTAVDDQRRTVKGGGSGPAVVHFTEFEQGAPGALFLYLYEEDAKASKLVALEGKVLVTPGRVLVAEFNGTQKQNKRVSTELFALESVQETGDGIQVTVACPPTKRMANARTPQDMMQALISERGAYTAEIEDSAGEAHPVGGGGTNGGAGTSSSGTGKVRPRGNRVPAAGGASQSFQFAALPEGRTIHKIRVKMTDRTGEPKEVPFTLKNIPVR